MKGFLKPLHHYTITISSCANYLLKFNKKLTIKYTMLLNLLLQIWKALLSERFKKNNIGRIGKIQ